jgi:LmbE family N-acetylglucosaminyl deacetylase
MLPRSTYPSSVTEGEGIASLLPSGRNGEASVLFIVAHPGDEIVAAGGSLDQLANMRFLHVTNGAAQDISSAFEDGFLDRLEYADARRKEFFAALECARLSNDLADELGYAAGEVARHLADLTMRIAAVLRAQQPDVVITHAYEGTHPDHDSIAFAVQTACTLLEAEGEKVPLRIEAAGFADWGSEPIVGEFMAPSFTEGVTTQLSRERRLLKQCMLERMPTRLRRLKSVPLNRESFRVAPIYDFTQPPQEGALHYEKSGDALTGKRWRRLAEEALRALGLAIG